tara:strand:+ start:1684 stop:3348 length:1665 start_codon:yes stop_codon:yes gene_type:complete
MGIHIDGPNSKITGDHFAGGNVTGVAATFTGDVGIGGTLTYEDVTNVDSVGLITARSGVHVGPTAGVGATIYTDGGARFSGVVTATTFSGSFTGAATNLTSIPAANLTGTLPAIDGSNLTGIDATAIKFGGAVKVQANASGAVATGILTANSGADAVTFLKGNSVGIGSTTTAGRNAGVGTATGEIIYNASDSSMQVWTGTLWETVKFKPPINVSGGTVSGSARSGYVTHTFTSNGALVTDGELTSAEVFVIGGGGGGGGNRYGGGGGAGGANYGTGITLPATTHPVLIGNGGSGGTAHPSGSKGSDGGSSAFQSTAPHPLYRVGRGGGGGGSHDVPQPHRNGQPGGCGGGATSYGGKTGGTTTQPPYNPGKPTNYGTAGANYQSNPNPNSTFGGGWAAAGGGGAGQAGFGPESPGANDQRFRGGGNGGDGVQLSISGTATYYGGGGGASSFSFVTPSPTHQAPNQMRCRGGNGGGGTGNNQPNSAPTQTGPGLNPYAAGTNGSSPNQHGIVNTGSGGAGAQPTWSFSLVGGNGGSGIVVVAYPQTQAAGEVRF